MVHVQLNMNIARGLMHEISIRNLLKGNFCRPIESNLLIKNGKGAVFRKGIISFLTLSHHADVPSELVIAKVLYTHTL